MDDELVSPREIIELIQAVKALTVEVKEQNDAYKKLNEDINGNGKPGLKNEVKELQEQIERLQLRLRYAYGAAMIVLGPLAAYTVIQVFQYGVDLITHFGKPPTP